MNQPPEIDCQTVQQKLVDGDSFLLLDCREESEHQFAHIKDSRLLPMSEIQQRISELHPFQNEEIIVYCHHGMRSLQVTNWLIQQGFSDVSSLAGGIDKWSCDIDPSVPRY